MTTQPALPLHTGHTNVLETQEPLPFSHTGLVISLRGFLPHDVLGTSSATGFSRPNMKTAVY